MSSNRNQEKQTLRQYLKNYGKLKKAKSIDGLKFSESKEEI